MRALGLMSGTSMDGVDAAVVETDGETIAGFGPSRVPRPTRPTSAPRCAPASGAGRATTGSRRSRRWCAAPMPRRWRASTGVELVGFHGQTLAHEPRGRGTHQIGRGDLLARDCGLPVVWDFRTADVASGGEGAPLVPFFHFACARWIGAAAPVAFLNLGGVGNVTWVDPRARRARGAGRAGRLRHRAGQRADRRLPRAAARARLRRRTARSRRRAGGRDGAAPGWPRIPICDGRRRSRSTGRTSTASSTGSRTSRPRTAPRRWPR